MIKVYIVYETYIGGTDWYTDEVIAVEEFKEVFSTREEAEKYINGERCMYIIEAPVRDLV